MSLIDRIHHYDLNGLRYGVREAGNPQGAPLILLHGLMDTGASFDSLVSALEHRHPDRYRYLAPDWRGHGESEAIHASYWFPDYLRDLDALRMALVGGDTPVSLIAHSMGGQVASLFAGARPKHVRHLIALDSLNVPDSDPADVPKRYRRWLDAHIEAPSARVYDDLDTAVARIGKRYPELAAEQIDRLARQWTAPQADGGRRLRVDPWHRVPLPYGFRASEAKALWAEVEAPVLCIDGGDSPARFFTDAEEMQARRACFATSEHVVIEGCGHMLHLQQPDAVAAVIQSFIDRHA